MSDTKQEIVSVRRGTLENMLRRARAPYSSSIPDYDAQVAKLFDVNRQNENTIAILLGKEPKLG